jgi:nitrite reductase/ring-hydroxylating ferredoxin subunit
MARSSSVAELPDGAIRAFTAGGVQGFLIHHNGQFHALSRVCTHMGCILHMNHAEQTFECPCHAAKFDLRGHLTYGPGQYDEPLPPLPPLRTRVSGGTLPRFARPAPSGSALGIAATTARRQSLSTPARTTRLPGGKSAGERAKRVGWSWP